MAKRKILILAANPKNSSLRRLDREVRDIEAGMRRSKLREEFEIVTKLALRTGDIQKALLDEQPAIVHFAGQGAGANGLIVEDKDGKAKLVSTQALARLFKFFKDEVECVVLNACYSEEQAEAIREHIGHVMGVDDEITNRQAIQFATGFYDALGAGRSYEDASEMGRIAVDISAPAISKTQRNLRTAIAVSIGVSIITVTSRVIGLLSSFELSAYDAFMWLSLSEQQDPRITIVGIRDEDLETLGGESEISDTKLLEALIKVESANPKVIGLDIFRDKAHGEPQQTIQEAENAYDRLVEHLQEEDKNIISTCFSTANDSAKGNTHAFEINDTNEKLVGFSNIVSDRFQKSERIRRQLLSMPKDSLLDCNVDKSLNYRVSLQYLKADNIGEQITDVNYIQLDQTVFTPVFDNTGGYSPRPNLDTAGDQILINYRLKRFPVIPIPEILNASDNSEVWEKLENKIVLMGYTSDDPNSDNTDKYDTPIDVMSGIELQAYMVRNILSAVKDEQPLVKTLPPEVDAMLIIFWCCLGGNLVWFIKPRLLFLAAVLVSANIIVIGYFAAFVMGGWWLPLIPSLLGLSLSTMSIVATDIYRLKKEE